MARFYVLDIVFGYLCDLYTTAGLFLEQNAAGTFVTSLVHAQENLGELEYWTFTAPAVALIIIVYP